MKKITCYILVIIFVMFSVSSCANNTSTNDVNSHIDEIYNEIESTIDNYYEHSEHYETLHKFDDIYSQYWLYDLEDIKYIDLDDMPELTFWAFCEDFDLYTDEELKNSFSADFKHLITEFTDKNKIYNEIKSNFESIFEDYTEFYQELTNADDLYNELSILTQNEDIKSLIFHITSNFENLQQLTLNHISAESNLSEIKTALYKIDFETVVTQLNTISSQKIFDIGLSRDEIKNLCINGLSSVVSALSSYEKLFYVIGKSLDNFEASVNLIKDYTKDNLSTLKYYFKANELTKEESIEKNKKHYSYLKELEDTFEKTAEYKNLDHNQKLDAYSYIEIFSDEYAYNQVTKNSKNKFLSERIKDFNSSKKKLIDYIIVSVQNNL